MTDNNFESQKNMRAGGYTALAVVLMLIIFIFVKWTLPPPPPPPLEEGLEVNLGNSDMGLGNDQPFLPGEPSPVSQQSYVPPRNVVTQDDAVKDIETDDSDPDAAPVVKTNIPKPEATRVPEKEAVKTKATKNPTPSPPAPPTPKPKAVFNGTKGNGTGGNMSDTYKKGGNEGIAGGSGDQGAPGGNPDSKNYDGGGTGNGIKISRGLQGRSIVYVPKYQDDFNENNTVAVDVKINKQGVVISASYQLRGSTTSESYFKQKAIEMVKKSKFNSNPNGPDEQTGTVLVNFKVRG